MTFFFAHYLFAQSLRGFDVGEPNTNRQREAHRNIPKIPLGQSVPVYHCSRLLHTYEGNTVQCGSDIETGSLIPYP